MAHKFLQWHSLSKFKSVRKDFEDNLQRKVFLSFRDLRKNQITIIEPEIFNGLPNLQNL